MRGEDLFENMHEAYEYSWPKPRVIVLSFPHNPTTACVDLSFFQRVVDFAREKGVVVVHDNAYAELGFDGYQPPSILQAEGAKECAVELYSMTKSFSMAGWRMAFLVGNAEVVQALAKLKSYLDYGTFQPIQIAATVTLNEDPEHPREVHADLPGSSRRAVRRAQPHRLGDRRRRRGPCSCGRRSPSPIGRWARSSSHRSSSPMRTSPRRQASASGRVARVMSASR